MPSSPHHYLRHGIARGNSEQVLREALAQMEGLSRRGMPEVLTLGHLSQRCGVPYPYLRSVVEHDRVHYRTFDVSRRSSKVPRHISVPSPSLMRVQRWLLTRVLDRMRPDAASYAYERGKSATACASRHVGAEWLVKLDLHNFFYSVRERSVYDIFNGAGYSALLSFEMARLCTRQEPASLSGGSRRYIISGYNPGRGYLPQGAPTSGALANLACRGFDAKLSTYARERGLVYTRYSDDLTFSGSNGFDRAQAQSVVSYVNRQARRYHFATHQKKTRISPPGARKIVLGMLVDGDRVRLRKEVRSMIEGHLRGAQKFGIVEHRQERNFSSTLGFISYFEGLLAHAMDVDPGWALPRQSTWVGVVEESGWISNSRFNAAE